MRTDKDIEQEKAYTTFEAARICHVTHHSIKNWIKQGLIRASRTPGGHYRILASDLEAFRKQFNMVPGRRSGKRRVMVIDDDPDALEFMGTILEREGYELIAVSNATEAGLLAAQMLPDLVILDFLMPDINGFEVSRVLRDNYQTKEIPILAVTCLTKPEEVQKILDSGVNGYLAKPFKMNEFLDKVKSLVEKPQP